MLPESSHKFEEACGGHCDYEWAFFFTLIGYTLILFIERVLVNPDDIHSHKHDSNEEDCEREHVDEFVANAVHSIAMQEVQGTEQDKMNGSRLSRSSKVNADQPVHIHGASNEGLTSQMASNYSQVSPYLLLAALSVHSLFEGIAIGLEEEVDHTLNLIFAILVHKVVAAVALGVALSKMEEMSSRKLY